MRGKNTWRLWIGGALQLAGPGSMVKPLYHASIGCAWQYRFLGVVLLLRLLESALFKVKIFDVVSSVVGLGADSAHIFPFREALLLETTSCAPGVAKDDG
jgi:hypothetical protein